MKTNTVINKKLLALAISASLMTLSAGAYAADHFISIDGASTDGNYNNDAATGTKNIVIGSNPTIPSLKDAQNKEQNTNNILIGHSITVQPGITNPQAQVSNSVAIGNNSVANQGAATSVGVSANADGWGASAYGYKAQAKNTGAAAVGNWAVASGTYSTAIGTSSKAEGAYSIASGVSAEAKGNQSVALGLHSGAKFDNGVALGAYSKATVDKATTAGYDPSGKNSTSTDAVWKATHAAVSVGSSDPSNLVTRQINNVAAGTKDADAVNVAQLKALNAANTEQLRAFNTANDEKLKTLEERFSSGQNSMLNQVREIESKIYDIGKKADASSASAIAQASIPQATKAGAAGIGVGTGVYNGQSAIAVGFSAVTPGESWVFKGSISSNSKGKFGAGAGALYQW